MNIENTIHSVVEIVGALYALSLLLNVFNPLIAKIPRVGPQIAAVLSTMGGHVKDARDELSALGKMPKIPPMLMLAFVLCSCSAAQRDTEIRIGDVGCKLLLTAFAPELAPLCTTLEEEMLAVNALDSTKTFPEALPASGKLVPPADDLHRQITLMRGDAGAGAP